MSAQLPPEVAAVVATAVTAGVDLVLGVVPLEVRRYVEGSPIWASVRASLADRLEHWVTGLVAAVLAPPVTVLASDSAAVKVTIQD